MRRYNCGRRRAFRITREMTRGRRTLHSRLYSESGEGGRGRGDGVYVDNRKDVFDSGRGLF